MKDILVATHNPGKLNEYADLLSDLPFRWLSLADVGIRTDVEETGHTFQENAVLKAVAYAEASGMLTLADDSGLIIDALNGEPGIYSARYGGPGLTDSERFRIVLDKMKDIEDKDRGARFHCVIAISVPGGTPQLAYGTIEGKIAYEPRGSNGFGYDPIFFSAAYGQCLAELAPEVKNRISHRAKALEAARPILRRFLID